MINRRAFIYLIITLLIGFALGLFSGGLYQLRKDGRRNPMAPPFAIGSLLARDLQLTDNQMDQLSDIFREYEKKAEQRREDIRKQVDRDLDSLRIELIPYLTDDQIQFLDRWIEGQPPPGPGPAPGAPEPGMFPPEQGHIPPPPGPGPPPGQGLPPGMSPHPPRPGERPAIQDTLPLK